MSLSLSLCVLVCTCVCVDIASHITAYLLLLLLLLLLLYPLLGSLFPLLHYFLSVTSFHFLLVIPPRLLSPLKKSHSFFSSLLFFFSFFLLLGNSGPSSQITTSLSIINSSTLANSERGPGIAMNQNNRNGTNNGMLLSLWLLLVELIVLVLSLLPHFITLVFLLQSLL